MTFCYTYEQGVLSVQQYLKEVARGKRGSKNLTYEETAEVVRLMIDGKVSDVQIAAYFIAQRMKMESSDELLAFVKGFQQNSDKLKLNEVVQDRIIDFAGPYTGRNTFAATIPSAILLAEKGIPTFLHSSESLPPKYGISIKAILTQLGVTTSQSLEALSETIHAYQIGFAHTDQFCPSLQKLRFIREELGVRTLMNTVEKLLNISNAKSIVMGAFHRSAIINIAPIFAELSYENVYIVQGVEGSEDLPVHRNSFIYKISKGDMHSFIVKPKDYDLFEEQPTKEKLTVREQADIMTALLSGETGGELTYYYKQLLFNTGIRYYLFGVTTNIEEGIEMTKEQLKLGTGLDVLQKWRNIDITFK